MVFGIEPRPSSRQSSFVHRPVGLVQGGEVLLRKPATGWRGEAVHAEGGTTVRLGGGLVGVRGAGGEKAAIKAFPVDGRMAVQPLGALLNLTCQGKVYGLDTPPDTLPCLYHSDRQPRGPERARARQPSETSSNDDDVDEDIFTVERRLNMSARHGDSMYSKAPGRGPGSAYRDLVSALHAYPYYYPYYPY